MTAEFEFKVTVHYYSLMGKCTQLHPLRRDTYPYTLKNEAITMHHLQNGVKID